MRMYYIKQQPEVDYMLEEQYEGKPNEEGVEENADENEMNNTH